MRIVCIDHDADLARRLELDLAPALGSCRVVHYAPELMGPPRAEYPWSEYDLVLLARELLPGPDTAFDWLKQAAQVPRMPPLILLVTAASTAEVVRAMRLGASNVIERSELHTATGAAKLFETLGVSFHTQGPAESNQPMGRRSVSQSALDRTGAFFTIDDNHDEIAAVDVPGYRVIRQLARTRMTNIMLAERLDDRLAVVLKLLDTRGDTHVPVLRLFMQEYAAVARIQHPRVIRIYERAFAKEFAFIAMEYLPGGDLAMRMADGLEVATVMHLLRDIAEGLAAIHEAGVVHRDLKPRNILFRADDELVISDFGAAHFSGGGMQPLAGGLVVGTPAYMSPEQCKGEPLDARSDLYSLGVIVFEMLTGRKPFQRNQLDALLADHVTTPAPPLPSAYAELQPLLDGLLAKAPQDRFQDVGELLAGLDWLSQRRT